MDTSSLSFNYSRLDTQSVETAILPRFGLANAVCSFFMLGLHDSYLVTDGPHRYILRLYRNDWRSFADIQFELELLTHIRQHGGRVAAPMYTTDHAFTVAVTCPEGVRYAALFPFARGAAVGNSITPVQAQRLGETIALIHRGTETFSSRHARQSLDLDFLLDASIPMLQEFLRHDQYQELLAIQTDLHNLIPALPQQWPETCYCSGDINLSNFHIDDDGITVFDFDQCGRGWRAFDIAKFYSSILQLENSRDIRAAFHRGYCAVSPLSTNEIRAIPYLVCVAIIWVMSIQVRNRDLWGIKRLDAGYWDRKMRLLAKSLSSASECEDETGGGIR